MKINRKTGNSLLRFFFSTINNKTSIHKYIGIYNLGGR